MHTAFGRENGSKTMVLMVHGIMGSPNQFRMLADSLREDVDYRCVLLPGHGCSMREFTSVRKTDWLRFIYETVSDLRKHYERLIFVGHSMGCLLGLMAQERIRFDGMLLISCPLCLRMSLRYPITGLRAAIEKNSNNARVRAAQAANSVQMGTFAQNLGIVFPYAELLKLIHQARLISKNADGIAVFSSDDEIVSAKSAKYLPGFQILNAPDSGHFFYSKRAQSLIFDALDSLIQSA